jgi:hypothetical protein
MELGGETPRDPKINEIAQCRDRGACEANEHPSSPERSCRNLDARRE